MVHLKKMEGKVVEDEEAPSVPLWRTLLLSTTSLVEALLWVGIGCYSLVINPEDTWNGVRDFLAAASWFYTTLRPIIWPTATAPYDLLVLYVVHFVFGIVVFFGHVYDHYVLDVPMPPPARTVVYIVNIVAVGGLVALVMSMPLGVPSKQVKKEEIVSIFCSCYNTSLNWISCRERQFHPKTTPLCGAGCPSDGCYLSLRMGPTKRSTK